METFKEKPILILMSGGVDSTALVHYYRSENYNIKGAFFDYGQKSNRYEKQAVQRIADYYNIEIEYLDLGFALNNVNGEYISRNALFILMAANLNYKKVSRIAIGTHYGTPYYDCSAMFMTDCQNIIDGYYDGTLTVEAPFLHYTKEQIFQYCRDNDIPLKLTYSCEKGNNTPCGTCPSCKDRSILNEF